MNAAARKRKPTAAQQQRRAAEEHPKMTLVPSTDEPAEQHESATAERCGATAQFSGERFTCGLPARHGGNHEGGKRSWRPRSGDAQ